MKLLQAIVLIVMEFARTVAACGTDGARLGWAVTLACTVVACSRARVGVPRCAQAAARRAATAAPAPPPPLASDLYLPPSQTGGSRYCLDPDSVKLRELLRAPIRRADDPIGRRALGADVAYLHALLRAVYVGYPELVQHRSFDVDAFFDSWRRTVGDGAGTIRFVDGLVRPLIELRAAHRDNHLMFFGWGETLVASPPLRVREYMADAEVIDPQRCDFDSGGHAFPSTLRNGRRLDSSGRLVPVVVVSLSGVVAELPRLDCDRPIELHPRAEIPSSFSPQAPAASYASVGNTAIITVRRFWGSDEERATLRAIADDYPEHRKHERIVFDLRGNPGGSDGPVFRWIERAKRGTWTLRPSVQLLGGLAPCRRWNDLVVEQITGRTVDTTEARAARALLRAEWPAELPAVSYRVGDGLMRSSSPSPYPGRIYVLVDRHSASAAESGAAALRSALGATLIGERTAGFLQYGNVQTFVLPHTGIRVVVPTKRFYYDPPVEGVGLAVDAYLDKATLRLGAGEIVPLIEALEGQLAVRHAGSTEAPPRAHRWRAAGSAGVQAQHLPGSRR